MKQSIIRPHNFLICKDELLQAYQNIKINQNLMKQSTRQPHSQMMQAFMLLYTSEH